jgi:hypothetical protein
MRTLLILIPIAICLMILPIAAHALAAASPAPVTALSDTSSLGIHGSVTYAGVPSGTVPLELRLYSGGVEYIISSTESLADGSYSFPNVPSLNSGDSYFVLYNNSIDPQFIYFWYTQSITGYTTGQNVDLGTFDIENLPQLTPPDGSNQSFPVDFTWTPRAIQTDKYQIHIVNYSGNDYYSPILNYTDTFRMNQLPNELLLDMTYYWEMFVFSPNGGYGVNTDWFQLTFVNNQIFLPVVVR